MKSPILTSTVLFSLFLTQILIGTPFAETTKDSCISKARMIIKNTSDHPAEKQVVINGVTIVKVRIEPNANIIIHSKEEPEDGKFVLQAHIKKGINRAIGRYLSVTIHNNGIEEVGVANDSDGAAMQYQNEMVQISIYVAMLHSVDLK